MHLLLVLFNSFSLLAGSPHSREMAENEEDALNYLAIWTSQHPEKQKVPPCISPEVQKVLDGRYDFFRSNAIHKSLPHTGFQTSTHGAAYSSGIKHPVRNGIMGVTDDADPSEDEIDRAIEFFSSKNLPFIWWSSSKKLVEKGFTYGGTFSGLNLDISKGVIKYEGDISIQVVKSEQEIKTFSEIIIKCFGMQPEILRQYSAVNYITAKKREQLHFLAYLDTKPVGTITLSTGPSTAGIWNFTTLPEHRNKGVGKALLSKALQEAEKQGYGNVIMILRQKATAYKLMQDFGFEEVCQLPFYIYDASARDFEFE